MPAISKEYYDAVSASSLSCFKFLHPSTTSCTKALLEFALNTAIGSSKFFLFLYTLQAISNRKKITVTYIKQKVQSYIRSVVGAICFGCSFHASLCFLRWCLNEFSFYSVALSGMWGGLALMLRSQQERSLDVAIFLNLVSETLLRYLYNENIIHRSLPKETLLFMTCSAILMYLLKTRKPGVTAINLWFYYPSQRKPLLQNTEKEETCTHKKSCSLHFYEGFYKYFAVGYALQLIKYFLPRLTTIVTNPAKIFRAFISKDKFLCGLMIGGYVGIYRIMSCALYRKNKSEKFWHPLLAGLLAGTTYRFKPTIPLLAIAFTTILQIQTIKRRNKVDVEYIKTEICDFLREMVFAMCFGINFHGSLCLMRRSFGSFYYYIVAASGFFAGLAIFWRKEVHRTMDTTICLNFAIETILRSLYTENIIKESVITETLLFMSCSAILMYLMKKSSAENAPINFWFYNPSETKPSSKKYTSGRSSLDYAYKGFTRYFLFGYLIQIVKHLWHMPRTVIPSPIKTFRAILSKDMVLSGLLFGSYVGVYRIVTCILRHHEKDEKPWHALVGGLFAGYTYVFKPTIPLLAIALTTVFQLTAQQFSFASNLQSKLPARELLFATCMGVAFHSRMLLPDACPGYVKQLMSSTSNGRVNEIYRHSSNILKNLQKTATL